jgi:integrase
MVPGDVYHALQAPPGIRKGMPGVRESEPVKPVPQAFIDATIPHLPPPVQAMVEVQLLTGMRPGEARMMRAIDIDMTGRVWVYRPAEHKTLHHGETREVYLGPKAQEVIRPWLKPDATACLFSPRDAEAARNARSREGRKTKLWPSHARHQAKKRKRAPKRAARDHYDVARNRLCPSGSSARNSSNNSSAVGGDFLRRGMGAFSCPG